MKISFFEQSFVQYLGFVIDASRVHTNPAKFQVLKEWLMPATITDLKSFLGGTNFYKKFICHYSHIARPLNQTRNLKAVYWTPEAERAFQKLKDAFFSAPVLSSSVILVLLVFVICG
jgi:hypothetical protein